MQSIILDPERHQSINTRKLLIHQAINDTGGSWKDKILGPWTPGIHYSHDSTLENQQEADILEASQFLCELNTCHITETGQN